MTRHRHERDRPTGPRPRPNWIPECESTVSGDDATSPAEDAARVLTQSMKNKKERATGKWVNHEGKKQVESHHYHVRGRDQELLTSKHKTIQFKEKHTTFKDMCHTHGLKTLDTRQVEKAVAS